MAITVSGTTITFNDSSTQTTSAIPSSYLAIGTISVLYSFSNTNALAGGSIPNASTGYATSVWNLAGPIFSQNVYRTGNVAVPGVSVGNPYPNTAAITGTWRALSNMPIRSYDPCSNITSGNPFLGQRIA